jgi:hypothetical protein
MLADSQPEGQFSRRGSEDPRYFFCGLRLPELSWTIAPASPSTTHARNCHLSALAVFRGERAARDPREAVVFLRDAIPEEADQGPHLAYECSKALCIALGRAVHDAGHARHAFSAQLVLADQSAAGKERLRLDRRKQNALFLQVVGPVGELAQELNQLRGVRAVQPPGPAGLAANPADDVERSLDQAMLPCQHAVGIALRRAYRAGCRICRRCLKRPTKARVQAVNAT